MKVSLIYPPSPFLLDSKVMPPLGILFLGAVLEQNGHEPTVTDMAGLGKDDEWKSYVRKALDTDPDLIGFTSTTPQFHLCVQMLDYIRQENNKVPVAIGGVHPTSIPKECVDAGFDAIAVGDGFDPILHMLEDIKDGKLKPGSGGQFDDSRFQVVQWGNQRSKPLGDRSGRIYQHMHPDFESLPFPARHLIDIKSYRYNIGDKLATTIYSQAGCPYSCS